MNKVHIHSLRQKIEQDEIVSEDPANTQMAYSGSFLGLVLRERVISTHDMQLMEKVSEGC